MVWRDFEQAGQDGSTYKAKFDCGPPCSLNHSGCEKKEPNQTNVTATGSCRLHVSHTLCVCCLEPCQFLCGLLRIWRRCERSCATCAICQLQQLQQISGAALNCCCCHVIQQISQQKRKDSISASCGGLCWPIRRCQTCYRAWLGSIGRHELHNSSEEAQARRHSCHGHATSTRVSTQRCC
jgi:hypothetical protein